MLKEDQKYYKVSTLGPEGTNSHYAAKTYMEMKRIDGEPILCTSAKKSFELLLKGHAHLCIVCNLYPYIHKLYIPNLHAVVAVDVFLDKASMGLYTREGVNIIKTVAAPITSTAFVQNENYELIVVNSNSEAALICKDGKADAAVSTKKAAKECGLKGLRSYETFNVPYTVFSKKTR